MSWEDIREWMKKRGVKTSFIVDMLKRNGTHTSESNIRTSMCANVNNKLREEIAFAIHKYDKTNGYE